MGLQKVHTVTIEEPRGTIEDLELEVDHRGDQYNLWGWKDGEEYESIHKILFVYTSTTYNKV